MPDEARPPQYGNEDDAEFREWLKNRKPAGEEVAPSVTFMEMMRQAAMKNESARAQNRTGDDLDSAADWTPSITPSSLPTFEDGQQAAVLPDSAKLPDSGAIDDALDETRRRRQLYRQRRGDSQSTPEPAALTEPPTAAPESSSQPPAAVGATHASSEGDTTDSAQVETASPPPAKPAAPNSAQARMAAIQRRRSRARAHSAGVVSGFIRSFILVFAAAGLMATMLTWFTPPRSIRESVSQQLSIVLETEAATFVPTQTPVRLMAGAIGRRVGIVAGHSGPQNDPGAVCPDGLTEASVNMNVAQLVVAELQNIGYTVDLLEEFDARLNNYQAAALVSIHANTCQDYGERVSGFLISAAARITARSVDDLLVECIARSYQMQTELARRPGVTVDMTDYHTFREIHPQTPAAIIELGFLRGDRELLTERPDLMARGITDGVLCFLQPAGRATSTAPLPTPTATATIQPP